jgi:hypothetical protein
LLLNILPSPIAKRLEAGEGTIADRFSDVTVLCADIVGFTPMSAQLPPEDVVADAPAASVRDCDRRTSGNRSCGSRRLICMSTPIKALALVMLAALIASCGNETPTDTGFRVTGHAHAGPVCPVQQDPPDPACADKPVIGATLVIVDEAGDEVAVIRTDTAGNFEAMLLAGNYTLVPQPVDGLLGTAPPQSFTTGRGLAPALDVAYDTGIR